MTHEYIETTYTEPLINDPGPTQMPRYPDFPCTSLLLRYQLQGYTWQKILMITLLIFPSLVILATLDFTIWLVKTLLKTFLESFGRKILGFTALFVFGFLLFWLIKSGEWEKLYEFCSKLFV